VARFLSADPLIQDPEHSQSYNRYSYVWNNPTNLTDPTGFLAATDETKGGTGQEAKLDQEKNEPRHACLNATGQQIDCITGAVIGNGDDIRANCKGKDDTGGCSVVWTRTSSANTKSAGFDGTKGCGQCGRHNPGADPYVAPPQEGADSHCPECYLVGTGGLIRGIARNMAVKLGLAEAEAAAVAASPSVWTLSPFERGVAIENQLGHNLPRNFPVIDRFENGVATSIKSMDLSATTYQSIPAMERTLTGYIDKVAAFNGRTWAGVTVNNVSSRSLELAIPVARSVAQQGALVRAVRYAHSVGVNMRVITIP